MKGLLCYLFLLLAAPLWAQENEDSNAPEFTVRGGLYTEPFNLEITTPERGAKIYYTTDGSSPHSNSRKYLGPIKIDGIKIIRACAYKQGKRGPIVTHSYFIGRPYTVPVVSIVTDSNNFFGFNRGIYVKGGGAEPNYPFRGANYWKDWERPINIEYYETDNTLGFNQVAGTKIFGGWSRPQAQKSLAIYARSRYGDKYFRHAIFPDKKIKKFKSLVLRNSGSDFNKSQFRDAFMTSLVEDIDLDIQAYQPVAVYINGRYWGLHNLREKITKHYLKSHHGVNTDSIDLMKHRNDLKEGSRDHYLAMLKFMSKNDLGDADNYAYIQTQMDVMNYAAYIIAETYFDNHDAGGNIRYWRPQTPDGRWRWVLFDTDFGFGIANMKAYKTNTVAMFTDPKGPKWPNPPWSTRIIRELLENDTFKNAYINLWADHLNTIYSAETVNAQLDKFEAQYREEMVHHFERWGGKIERWDNRINRMRRFAALRPHYCFKHLGQKFDVPDTMTLAVTANDWEMGRVQVNTIQVKKDTFNGIYFQAVPVVVEAQPKFDYDFVGWEGHDSKNPKLILSQTEAVTLKAIFEPRAKSGLEGKLVINEVSFNAIKAGSGDWIELYNNTDSVLDISRWFVLDAKDKNQFRFPENTTIAARSYVVVCEHPDSLVAAFGDTLKTYGPTPFGLSSKADQIRVYDAEAMLVDSMRYRADKDAKAKGILALDNPNFENAQLDKWSLLKKGTPGGINPKFRDYLRRIAEESFQKKVLWGSIAGFCLLGALVAFVMFRKRRKRATA